MSSSENVVQLEQFKRQNDQQLIDDIGARAFLFIRDEADTLGVPVKDVIVEHMLGLALVMGAVEGKDEVKKVLDKIGKQLNCV